jgi:hypothetical protein
VGDDQRVVEPWQNVEEQGRRDRDYDAVSQPPQGSMIRLVCCCGSSSEDYQRSDSCAIHEPFDYRETDGGQSR